MSFIFNIFLILFTENEKYRSVKDIQPVSHTYSSRRETSNDVSDVTVVSLIVLVLWLVPGTLTVLLQHEEDPHEVAA